MSIGEGHDAASLKLAGRAAHGFERQTKVAADVRAAHGQLHVADVMTCATGRLDLLKEHCQPAHSISAADDDGLALRFAELVGHFAQKLILEFGVTPQQSDQLEGVDAIHRGRSDGLSGADVESVLGEPEYIL